MLVIQISDLENLMNNFKSAFFEGEKV